MAQVRTWRYRFRYHATPTPGRRLDPLVCQMLALVELEAHDAAAAARDVARMLGALFGPDFHGRARQTSLKGTKYSTVDAILTDITDLEDSAAAVDDLADRLDDDQLVEGAKVIGAWATLVSLGPGSVRELLRQTADLRQTVDQIIEQR
jgi:alkylhydroperoxidase family enzyme